MTANKLSRTGKENPVTLIMGLLLALFLAFGWLPENYFWGFNHLYFQSSLARMIFPALAVLLFFLPIGAWLETVQEKSKKINHTITGLVLAASAAVLFSIFRVSVHSLGDGYQRAFEIARGQWYQPTQFLDYLVHVGAYDLLKRWFDTQAVTAMAITSIVAGVAFVWMIWKSILFSGQKKLVFSLSVLFLGCSQLFFGYAESYTLVYLFAVWYITLIFREDDKPAPYLMIAVTYLLAAFSHQIGMIVLLPSLWYLSLVRFRKNGRKYIFYPLAAIIGLAPYAAIKLINHLIAFEEIRDLSGYFLPLLGDDYGIFHPAHLFDILNLILLVAPILLIFMPLWPDAVRQGRQRILALTLIIPSLLFILLLNPELTLARDWDAFSIPLAVAAVSILVIVINCLPDSRPSVISRLSRPIMATGLILFSWILLNNSTGAHLHRAEYLLDHAIEGRRYGYELLAHYYHSQKDYVRELTTLEKVEIGERNARLYGKLAQAAWLNGKEEKAYQYAQKGVQLPDATRLTLLMAGITAFDRAQFNDAIPYLREAAKIAPHDIEGLCKLGDALFLADSLNAAEQIFQRALSLDPNQARPYFGLAYVYYKQENYRTAQMFCRQGLNRNPGYTGGRELWERLQVLDREGRTEPEN